MKIELYINGELNSLEVKPLDRLLDILRSYKGLTGTKEGCGEGECGACAVILDGRLVNSCMVAAMQLHGSRVITVEGLGKAPDALQVAFVEEGAVQCGFCTPGMVMASRALLARCPHPDRDQIKEGLAGNLCRCTGYEKIIKAVLRAAEEGYGSVAVADLADIDLKPAPGPVYLDETEKGRIFLPETVEQACEMLGRDDNVYMVGGGTDFFPDLKKGMAKPDKLMDITHLCELKHIVDAGGELRIGSCVTTERLAENGLIGRHFPSIQRAADESAAVAIKNRATIGGNLMTASPAADMPPVLLMLGARLVFNSLSGRRTVPVSEFFTGYRKTARRQGEILEEIIVPYVQEGTIQRFYKRGSRKSLTIARINMACSARMEGGVVRDLVAVAGTMGVLPTVMVEVSALVEGRKITSDLIERVRELGRDSVHPRTSQEYRKNVSGNMIGDFMEYLAQEG